MKRFFIFSGYYILYTCSGAILGLLLGIFIYFLCWRANISDFYSYAQDGDIGELLTACGGIGHYIAFIVGGFILDNRIKQFIKKQQIKKKQNNKDISR